jgi:uncharacterized membrane protein
MINKKDLENLLQVLVSSWLIVSGAIMLYHDPKSVGTLYVVAGLVIILYANWSFKKRKNKILGGDENKENDNQQDV